MSFRGRLYRINKVTRFMRTIIFGDIHGCYGEWAELLKKVDAKDEDQLVAVGDLIAKGPSTRRVLDLAMSLPNFKSVLGNHDWAILKAWREKSLASVTQPDHRKVIDELGEKIDKYMQYIDSWPLYLDLSECLVVHAGLRPGVTLENQESVQGGADRGAHVWRVGDCDGRVRRQRRD